MRRGAVIGIAAGAALIAAVGVVGALWVMRAPGPDAVAEEFLRGLSSGDADAVAATLADTTGAASALTAFAGATSYLGVASFTTSEQTSGAVVVDAEAQLDDDDVAMSFVLDQTPAGWKVTDGYVIALTVTTTLGDAVRVGGELVDADTPIALLPATYPVTASPDAFLDGELTVAVAGDGPVSVELTASVSDDAVGAAQQHLDEYIDACVATADEVADHCGLRVPWAADLADLDEVSYRVDARPVLALDARGGVFTARGGVIVATASGRDRDGEDATFRYRTDDWTLRGGLEFTGDEMVLSVD